MRFRFAEMNKITHCNKNWIKKLTFSRNPLNSMVITVEKFFGPDEKIQPWAVKKFVA